MGKSRPLFCLFSSFTHYNFNNTNSKSIDGVLWIWTYSCRIVGADETTELWRPFFIRTRLVRTYLIRTIVIAWGFGHPLCHYHSYLRCSGFLPLPISVETCNCHPRSYFLTGWQTTKVTYESCFLILANPGLLCLFSSFTHHNSNINWIKRWWCALDLNLRQQNGRRRRIHWSIVATTYKCRYERCSEFTPRLIESVIWIVSLETENQITLITRLWSEAL